jgi:hypothetical protein
MPLDQVIDYRATADKRGKRPSSFLSIKRLYSATSAKRIVVRRRSTSSAIRLPPAGRVGYLAERPYVTRSNGDNRPQPFGALGLRVLRLL